MTKKHTLRVLLAALLLLSPALLAAAPVSLGQAESIAKSFLKQKGIAVSTSAPIRRSKPAGTQAAATPYYYVFNASAGKGFVVVSGDDRTPQVLGYADSGSLDVNNLPDNVKSFLQSYADGIKYLNDNDITAKQDVAMRRSATTHSVSPLLETKWNQAEPYNNLTPKWNGQTTVTGCVATATAQVMNYYKYPEQTTVEIPSYSYNVNNITTTVPSVAAGSKLDWSNMLPAYTSSATDAQNNAVAQLMLYVGKAVNMHYLPASYGGSSATDASISPALKKYFDYSSQRIMRSDYTLSEFEGKVYGEVADARPVIFCGQSSGGGHCFVIDGYDASDGLFHVNWGWGGMSDGYFLLSVLNPDNTTGIGASTSGDGYTAGQSAIIGITKGAGTQTVKQALTVGNLTVSGTTMSARLTNATGSKQNFDVGLAVCNSDGSVIKAFDYYNQIIPIEPDYSLSSDCDLSLSLSRLGLTDGTNYVAFASKVDGTDEWIVNEPTKDLVKVEVSNGKITSMATVRETPSVDNLSVTNWNFTGSKLAGNKQSVTITLNNSGAEYYGNVYLYVNTVSSKPNGYASLTGLTAKAHGTTSVDMAFTPTSAGTYNVWLCAYKGNELKDIGTTTVEITEGSATADLSLDNLKVNNDGGNTNVNGYIYPSAYGKSLSGTVTLKNNAASPFVGSVILYLMKHNDGSNQYTSAQSVTPSLNIPANGTGSFDFNFDGLTANDSYGLGLYYSNRQRISDMQVYYLLPGVITYSANGASTTVAASATVAMPDDATSIDLSDVEGTVTAVTPNGNPNALYIFNTETAAAKALEDAGKNVVVGGTAENLTLTEDNDFSSPVSFTAATATFKRTLPQGTDGSKPAWYTISLPFDVNSITTADRQEKKWFTSADDTGKQLWVMGFSALEGNNVRFDYNVDGVLKANTPYIIEVPGNRWGESWNLAGKELTFTGNNVTVSSSAEAAVTGSEVYNFIGTSRNVSLPAYILNTAENSFVYTDNGSAKPFTAYFINRNATASTALKSLGVVIGNSVATGINTIGTSANASSTDEYNLAGQRVGSGYKGIVIKNGKKVIRK